MSIGDEMLREIKRREKEAEKLAALRIATKEVFSTRNGEKILAQIWEMSGMGASSYVRGDPYQTAFNEGKKEFARKLNTVLATIDPDLCFKPIKPQGDDND